MIFAGRNKSISQRNGRWKLLFTRANRTIDKIYGTLFVLRERCTNCAMFYQIENTRGIVVRIKQRQRRQISNSTIRKIPPLVKYSKHRTKLPRKQLGKWTWYKNVCHKKPIWVYIIEYLEIDTKSKHRVWKKIIAVPFPFDRSCENLEPRRFVAYRRSKIRSISPTDFSSFRWKIEKKNPSVRPPIDSRSLPLFLIFLDSASSKKKGGRKRKEKKKKRIQREERERDRLFCEPSLLSGQIEFLQSWRGRGGGERVAQRACKSERGTTYFYPGRSTGRYGFFARCRRSRVSWRAFEGRRGGRGGKEREMDIRRDGKRGERRRDSGRKFKVLLDLSSKRNGIPTWWVCSVCLLFRIRPPEARDG